MRFLAPYAILFFVFYLLPVCSSIFFSFTYYNILEKPRFIGLQNYINLILQDDIFLTSIKNTFFDCSYYGTARIHTVFPVCLAY